MDFNRGAWEGRIRSYARKAGLKGLDLAGKAMAADVRRRIGVDWGGVASSPGQPPRKRTGELQRSIFYEVDDVNMRVYVIADDPKAFLLEYGTDRMAPRPIMRGSLAGMAAGGLSRYVSVAFAAPFLSAVTAELVGAGAGDF